jgi:hypothetical protein
MPPPPLPVPCSFAAIQLDTGLYLYMHALARHSGHVRLLIPALSLLHMARALTQLFPFQQLSTPSLPILAHLCPPWSAYFSSPLSSMVRPGTPTSSSITRTLSSSSVELVPARAFSCVQPGARSFSARGAPCLLGHGETLPAMDSGVPLLVLMDAVELPAHGHLLCSPARVLELSMAPICACPWSRAVAQLSLCSVPAAARVLVGVLSSPDRSFPARVVFPARISPAAVVLSASAHDRGRVHRVRQRFVVDSIVLAVACLAACSRLTSSC